MCRAIGINLQTSYTICISRKVVIIYSDSGSSRSSEDDSIVVLCWRCELVVRYHGFGKYAVSMLRAEVHWRWRQRVSLEHLYLLTSSQRVKCHKEKYRSLHLNPTLTVKRYFNIHFNSNFLSKTGSVKRPILKSWNQNLVYIVPSTVA
jgi:hypothetical protein